MPCALADMSRAGIHSAGSLTWNWAIWPVAGDPVEAKKSPVGYPIGLLILLRSFCQYLPDHVRERLVLFLGLAF